MSTIESKINLYHNVPLDNTYRNVINGGINYTKLADYSFVSYEEQTYCRIVGQYNNKVRLNTGYGIFADYYMGANYISIENKSGRVIFGFITDVLYINDNVVEITFEIDCFHTYYGDYTFSQCFVERASPDPNWSPSNYSIPDYIEKSEYLTLAEHTWSPATNSWRLYLMFAPSQGFKYDDTHIQSGLGEVNGFTIGANALIVDTSDADAYNLLLGTLNNNYHRGFKCIGAWYIPSALITHSSTDPRNDILNVSSAGNMGTVNSSYTNSVSSMTLNGVSLKNKKTLCYPYTFLEVSNNLGEVKRYAYEGFSGSMPLFTALGIGIPSPSITLVPRNYFGKEYDFDNAICITNFPQVPVQADTIASWESQTGTALGIKTLGNTVTGAIVGGLYGGGLGAAIGGFAGLTQGVTQAGSDIARAENSPSSMTGISGCSTHLILGQIEKLGFTFRHVSLRGDCLQAIDDYFTRFGVAEQRVESPPIHRAKRTGDHHMYIKTKGCTIRGESMPVWAEKKVCEIHDNGVTYWDSLSDVGDY